MSVQYQFCMDIFKFCFADSVATVIARPEPNAFYFAYYSILQFLKIPPISYSPKHANYFPIILISNPHLLLCNENSHIHEAVP